MKRILAMTAAISMAACGGGGGNPSVDHASNKPVVALVSPADGATLTGTATITVKATGDRLRIKSLAFTAPASFASATPTMDAGTFSATIAADVNTRSLADGILSVSVAAVDEYDQQTTATYSFPVSSSTRSVTIDAQYLSVYDEENVGLVQDGGVAVSPAQYRYASGTKVAVADGTTIHKIPGRTGWSGAAPSAADLNANPGNLPVMRLLTPHLAGEPALASAKAIVRVGVTAPVTVDLIPDVSSPEGQQAYLLPLASNLVPALAKLDGASDVIVAASVTDALGHSAAGGLWTVHVVPVSPPVVVSVDAQYSASADPRSAFVYGGLNYLSLWTNPSAFALDNGVRVSHVIITNPGSQPVSVGVTLGGARSWSIAEAWSPHLISNAAYLTCTRACHYNCSGGSGTPDYSTTCDRSDPGCGGTAPFYYQPGGGSWACVSTDYTGGPPAVPFGASGTLKTTAYLPGGTVPAPVAGSGRYVVPAGGGSSAGRVDLYVVRPIATDRTGAPSGTWASGIGGYETPLVYQVMDMSTCTLPQWSGGTCTYYMKQWDRTMTRPTETISGTLAVDGRAYDPAQNAEFGPLATALPETSISTTITH